MAELVSLSDIFNNKYYRVPDYQRGYAWGKAQLDDFWDDLNELELGRIHYTGVLTLEDVTDSERQDHADMWQRDNGANKSNSVCYVVDGQQRLTTSVILIKVLLDSVKDEKWFCDKRPKEYVNQYIGGENPEGSYYYFGYTADNPSFEFLKTRIFGNSSITNENKDTLYTKNLEDAKKFFENKIKKISLTDKEVVFKKLTENFKFNKYIISDEMDVFVAFETMNNRGKKLSNLELLKNRLIYISTKFNKEQGGEALRYEINTCWKNIYEFLGKNKDNILDDDDFLKNHWIMYFSYNREVSNAYMVDLLDKIFTSKEVNKTLNVEYIRQYINSLKDSIEKWYILHNVSEYNGDKEIKILLEKLYRLNYGAFKPILMAVLLRPEICKVDFVDLLKIIERYIFLIFYISRRRSNTGDSSFYADASEYYKNNKSIVDIIANIKEWLVDYIKPNHFYDYIQDKFNEGGGYYYWNGLKYFMYEYELYLREKSKNSELKISWNSFTNIKNNYCTIEHILPQTPDGDWKKVVKGLRVKKIQKIVGTIGNLVPLANAKNSKLSNYDFLIKKSGKDGEFVGYYNGSYSENEIAKENVWGLNEIKVRSEKLIKFLFDHWEIETYLNEDESNTIEDLKKRLTFMEDVE